MNQMYHLNQTTNQENQKQHEGAFTRARAHAPISAPVHAHTHEGAKSPSRISLLPLLVAFAVTMIVGVGNVWGQNGSPLNTGTGETSKDIYENPGTAQSWFAPAGYYISKIECWGGGGNGSQNSNGGAGGDGSGGSGTGAGGNGTGGNGTGTGGNEG